MLQKERVHRVRTRNKSVTLIQGKLRLDMKKKILVDSL